MTHYQKFLLTIGRYLLCGSCIQPKKQFKVQIIGILEEIDSFNDQKCTYKKVTKKLGRALSLIWTKSKRTAVFSRETVPYFHYYYFLAPQAVKRYLAKKVFAASLRNGKS